MPACYLGQAPIPLQKRVTLFGIVGMPVINSRDVALNMVQDFTDHQALDANGRHMRGGGAPEIVELEADTDAFFTLRIGFCKLSRCRPRTLGNTYSDPLASARSPLRMLSAWGPRGTRWASLFFERAAGRVHHPASRSSSSHLIPRTSPRRCAVRRANRNTDSDLSNLYKWPEAIFAPEIS